jgi:hypothetical protein
MGSKMIDVGELAAIPLTYETLAGGRDELTAQLLANISTSGAGDLALDGVDALSYLIFEIIQTALFINSQDYDIEASAAALLAAQGA